MVNVNTILSKIEIQDTTVRHFRAMDDGDVDAYLATWTPEENYSWTIRPLSRGTKIYGAISRTYQWPKRSGGWLLTFTFTYQPSGELVSGATSRSITPPLPCVPRSCAKIIWYAKKTAGSLLSVFYAFSGQKIEIDGEKPFTLGKRHPEVIASDHYSEDTLRNCEGEKPVARRKALEK